MVGWKEMWMNGLTLLALATTVLATELPSWRDLSKHYPGYKHNGKGQYTNLEIFAIVGKAPLPQERKEDTSALRLSLAFNRLGGEHSLGATEIHISKNHEHDSVMGRDGQQYIYRTIAYGPFLAMKYGSPELIRTDPLKPGLAEKTIKDRRGIVRYVLFHKSSKLADARIGLWDCDQLLNMRQLNHIHHLISVEFWELPGSKCENSDK
ncbi:uncharacterized protein [Watersipora subatra]|uniref:uncharacterized protein n=1 Tax=Watersipora subatra TaxID=2589382 RepID=UPI00355C962D